MSRHVGLVAVLLFLTVGPSQAQAPDSSHAKPLPAGPVTLPDTKSLQPQADPKGSSRDTAVAISWGALYVDHRTGLRSGQDILVKVSELGALCYDTDIRINQTGAAAVTGKLISILQGNAALTASITDNVTGATPEGSGGAEAVSKAAEQQSHTDAIHTSMVLKGLKGMVVAARKNGVAADIQANVTARIDAAVTRIGKADGGLKEIAKRQTAAAVQLAAFYTAACPKGRRGGPEEGKAARLWGPVAEALAQIVGDMTVLADVGKLLDSAEVNLKAATSRIESLRNSLDADEIAYRDSDAGKAILSRDPVLAASSMGRVSDLRATSVALAKTRKEMAAALESGKAALAGHNERLFLVAIGRATEELEVVIAATGREDVPTVKGEKFEDKLTLPVLRRRRYFETVGPTVILGGEFPRFALVNQRILTGDSTKTRSAYADRNGGKWYAVAPTIFGHMTLFDWNNEAALLGTLGVGTRSTAGGLRPDFFMGCSLSLGDRFAVTLGLAIGWRERLIDTTLTTGPVPKEITPESAISTQVKPGLAFALSFRP